MVIVYRIESMGRSKLCGDTIEMYRVICHESTVFKSFVCYNVWKRIA